MLDSNVAETSYKWDTKHSSTAEGQVFYATTASGLLVIFQLAYSSMNTWSHSIQFSIRIHGDGLKKVVTRSFPASDFKITESRYSVTCVDVKSTKQELGNNELIYDISYHDPHVSVDLKFVAVSAVQVGDGIHYYKEDHADGFVKSHFITRANVSGNIFVDGKKHSGDGYGSAVFSMQNPPQDVLRWNFFNIHSIKDTLLLYQFEMADDEHFVETKVVQGVLVMDGVRKAFLLNNDTKYLDSEIDTFSDYLIPHGLTHELTGKTSDGEIVRVKISLGLHTMIDTIDVLAELPYLLRVFIQTFVTSPFVYQWREDTVVEVDIGGKKTTISGKAFQECTFLEDLN